MAGRGVVCRVKSRSAVVLTADFEFVEIRKRPGMQTGQEVRFAEEDLLEYRRPTRLPALAASFMALLLVVFMAFPRFFPEPAVYAYVSVEVNPGIELALDRSLTVVGMEALNADGAELLPGLDLVGIQAVEAVAAVVRACREKGYLGRGAEVRHLMMTTTLAAAEGGTALQSELITVIQGELDETGGQTGVYIFDCSVAAWEQARQAGLSPAHYVVWQKALEEGIEPDREAIRRGGLREALAMEGREYGAAVAAAAKMQARAGRGGDEAQVGSGLREPKSAPGHDRRAKESDGFPGKPPAEPAGRQVPTVPERPSLESTGGNQEDMAVEKEVGAERLQAGPEGKRQLGGDDTHGKRGQR